jgi:transposase
VCAPTPAIAGALALTETFAHALHTRQPDILDNWLEQVQQSTLPMLKTFAVRCLSDFEAIRAAFSSLYSNGQLEGHITRLKLRNRQMYGRASFNLLRLRVLRL